MDSPEKFKFNSMLCKNFNGLSPLHSISCTKPKCLHIINNFDAFKPYVSNYFKVFLNIKLVEIVYYTLV